MISAVYASGNLDDVLEEATAQQVRMFNVRFESFYGRPQNAASIRQLILLVNNSNAEGVREVEIEGFVTELEEDPLRYEASNLTNNRMYTVEFDHDEHGFISNVTISEVTEIIPEDDVPPTGEEPPPAQQNNVTQNENETQNQTPADPDEDLPQTGLSNAVIIILAICGISAIYAFKKIKEYDIKH